MYFQKTLLDRLRSGGDRIAIDSGERRTTYAVLLAMADKVTSFLLGLNLEGETRVGIMLSDRSDIIIAMIGTINARCVFVPLDSSLPEGRLASMVGDMDLGHVINSGRADNPFHVSLDGVEHYGLSDILSGPYDAVPGGPYYPCFDGQDSLYIYFTSGSTGKPKGIIGKNCSLLQFVQWEIAEFNLGSGVRFSQLTSPYFDAFLRDIFVPLLSTWHDMRTTFWGNFPCYRPASSLA